MIELAELPHHPAAAAQASFPSYRFGEDRAWLTVMAVVTAAESAWWAVVWYLGFAPPPFLLTYIALAFAALVCALALRTLLQPRLESPNCLSGQPKHSLSPAFRKWTGRSR
jgi:hypothetical protein